MKNSGIRFAVPLLIVLSLGVVGCDIGVESTPTPTPAGTPSGNETLPELRVYFLDVGQGDAIMLDLGETEVLIDGGGRSSGITSYLEGRVDGPLEAMIATHPAEDHIGGLVDVLEGYDVDEIWHNGEEHDSEAYREFMEAAGVEGARVNVARRGDVIDVDGLALYVLHPRELDDDLKNNSIVLGFSYGNGAFLFTGDAGMAAEASMLMDSSIQVPDIDILKVGDHCSRRSSQQSFLETVKPEIAIYAAGKDNEYGYPHDDTLARLVGVGAQVYGTDVHGTMVVVTRGVAYQVYQVQG